MLASSEQPSNALMPIYSAPIIVMLRIPVPAKQYSGTFLMFADKTTVLHSSKYSIESKDTLPSIVLKFSGMVMELLPFLCISSTRFIASSLVKHEVFFIMMSSLSSFNTAERSNLFFCA